MSVEGMLGRRCLSTEVTMADKEIGQVFQDVACFCSRSILIKIGGFLPRLTSS